MRKRTTCSRCGEKAKLYTWTLAPCALHPKQLNGRLCERCDEELNEFVLSFFRVRNRRALMEKYRAQPE